MCSWMGFSKQVLELCEEKMMRTGVLVGRFTMVILVLCWNPAQGAPSWAVGETRGFEMFQCLSCPPVPGNRQCLWYILIIFTAFGGKWEHLLLLSHCKQPGSKVERILWNKALFPQEDFSFRNMWRGHGRLLPTAELCLLEGGAVPLRSSSSGVLLLQGAASFYLQGLLSCHTGANGHGQGELQLQAGEKSSARHYLCIAFHEPCRTLSQLRFTLSRVGLRMFSFHVLPEYIMQWALGF